jgi:lysozyme
VPISNTCDIDYADVQVTASSSCIAPRGGTQAVSPQELDLIRKTEGYADQLQNTCLSEPRLGSIIPFLSRTSNCQLEETSETPYGLYDDVGSNCTVGFGRLEHYGPCNKVDVTNFFILFPTGITYDQANSLLLDDVNTMAVTPLNGLLSVQLTQEQFDALVDFAYNAGQGHLAHSTLLKDINSGKCGPSTITKDFHGEPTNPTEWDHCRGDGNCNTIRRADEAQQFNTNKYPNDYFHSF